MPGPLSTLPWCLEVSLETDDWESQVRLEELKNANLGKEKGLDAQSKRCSVIFQANHGRKNKDKQLRSSGPEREKRLQIYCIKPTLVILIRSLNDLLCLTRSNPKRDEIMQRSSCTNIKRKTFMFAP